VIAAESYLDGWTDEQYRMVEKTILIAQHRLHQSGLFSDEALIELIDRHPEEYVTIAAMGNDANRFEWMNGERGDVSAADMLRLVREKQLWLNLIRLNRFQPEYARLVDSLYDELERHCPGFKAKHRSANLLISSPNAMVYYHIDLPVNMLWHLRGEKQVWVYPPFDDRFASPQNIERIIVGEMAEDMPYQPWFEDYALNFKLKPGQMITWPQNTPHRVTNLDGLNVSLSTEHRNRMAKRRINVHLANHYLREQFGCDNLSTDPRGWSGQFKEVYARACRVTQKLLAKKQFEPFGYGKSFRLDTQAERGFVMLEQDANPEREAVIQELVGAAN